MHKQLLLIMNEFSMHKRGAHTHELNYREAWGTVIPRGPPHLKVALLLASCDINRNNTFVDLFTINIMG